MRFQGLDLNLLVALDALLTERNLTAAARSVNLSQPAMSAALARLRRYFRDVLDSGQRFGGHVHGAKVPRAHPGGDLRRGSHGVLPG